MAALLLEHERCPSHQFFFFLTKLGALLPSQSTFCPNKACFFFYRWACESDLQFVHVNSRLSLGLQMYFETCQRSCFLSAMAEYVSMRYKMMVEVVWAHICLYKSWNVSETVSLSQIRPFQREMMLWCLLTLLPSSRPNRKRAHLLLPICCERNCYLSSGCWTAAHSSWEAF